MAGKQFITGNGGALSSYTPNTAVSFFMKLTAYPSTRTALVDWSGGALGYHRLTIANNGILQAQAAWPGVSGSVVNTVAVPLNAWTWVMFVNEIQNVSGVMHYICRSQIVGPGNTVLNDVRVDAGAGGVQTRTAYNTQFAFGVSLSGGFTSTPNSTAMKFSKLKILYDAYPTFPTADPTGGVGLYNVRQAAGNATRLFDTSGATVDPFVAPYVSIGAGTSTLATGAWQVSYAYTTVGGGVSKESPVSTISVTATNTQTIVVGPISLPTDVTGVIYYVSTAVNGTTRKGNGTVGTGNQATITAPGSGGGAVPSGTNTTGVHFDLVAGTQALTVYSDGPYG